MTSPSRSTPLPPGADGAHITYCRLCEAQCGLVAQVEAGRIVKVQPDRQHVTSAGHLCVKGPGMLQVTYDPDRVLTPLRRTGAPGCFEAVSWDEAMTDIAQRLQALLQSHGGDSVGLYVGNPAAFSTQHYTYAKLFARAIGSTKFYNAMHVDTGAKHLGMELVFGHPYRYTFPDLERCDFLLMLGANPLVSHMSMVTEPRAHKKLDDIARRGAVVVVDPRRTETARRFEHVAVRPDTDAWLLSGMLKTVFDEGLADLALLQARVDGWQALRDAVCALPLDQASTRCGVPVETIVGLARRFAAARAACCYGRVGTNRGSFSTLVNVLMEALNLACGRFGRPGGAVMGQSVFENPDAPPIMPPAYGSAHSRVGGLPLVGGAQPGGALAREILTPGAGQIRALVIDSGNPVLAYPDGDTTRRAFEALDLMVALDLYVTESSRHAHYILPAATFFERADLTDMWSPNGPRPWLQAVGPVIEPLGESRVEFAFYDELARRLDRGPVLAPMLGAAADTAGPIELADAMLRQGTHGDRGGQRPDGLSVEALRTRFPHGAALAPQVDAEASWQRVALPGQRPRLWHPVIAAEIERLRQQPASDRDHPFKLFGRRKLRSLNSWMHNSEELVRSDTPTLLVHPDDARALGIVDGQAVRVSSPGGRIEVVAEVSDDVVPGSVNYPHGWGHDGGWRHANGLVGANVNLLASGDPKDWEPVSGMCLLDGIPVAVTPL